MEVDPVLAFFVECLVVLGKWTPNLLLPDADEPHVGSIDVSRALAAAKLKDECDAERVKLVVETKHYRVGEKDFQWFVEVDLKDGEKPVLVALEFLVLKAVKLQKNKFTLLQEFRVLQIEFCRREQFLI